MHPIRAVLIGSAALLMLVACAPPDRSAQADELRTAVNSMPGVRRAEIRYEHSFTGSLLAIDVSVPDATPDQIRDLVNRINAVRGDAFREYPQSADFEVIADDHGEIRLGADLDAAEIAEDTARIRRLAPLVGGAVTLFRGKDVGGSGLTLSGITVANDVALHAVHDAFGDTIPRLQITSAVPGAIPTWTARAPYTAGDERLIAQKLADAPVTVTRIEVGPQAVITTLVVSVHGTGRALSDLEATIAASGAGRQHPMMLFFRLDSDPQGKWAGSVDVGGCDYVNSESDKHPEQFLSAETLAVQQQLRREFDTCRRAR